MEVAAQDQLSRGARIALEPHHAGLPGELPAGPVAVQPIEDLALVQDDRLLLPLLADVLLEGGELGLAHGREHQGKLVGFVGGHGGVTSRDPA